MKKTLYAAGLALCVACTSAEPASRAAALRADCDDLAFAQPAGTVAVNFAVDDRLNRVYGEGDLKWKGSFLMDPATRILVLDPVWSGATGGGEPMSGWPTLHDDGPWSCGGHEPAGAQPGDHVWGITAFVAPPTQGELAFEYGLIDASYETRLGNGWIWDGSNGAFSVAAGTTEPIDARGMRFPKFGKQDLRLALDTKALTQFEGWTWDTSFVGVKSSWWGWGVLEMEDLGDGVHALELAPQLVDLLPHTGLMRQEAEAEFVFVLGADEYKAWFTDGTNWWPEALQGGVSAATRCKNGDDFVAQPVELADNGNTEVEAPPWCREAE